MNKRLRLRFVGADGSLGYRRGTIYDLDVVVRRIGGPLVTAPRTCPYSSWRTFWQNWETA